MDIDTAIKAGIEVAVDTILKNINPTMSYDEIVGIIKCLTDNVQN